MMSFLKISGMAGLLALLDASRVSAELPRLRVTTDGRHIETVEGKPFFLLADTAWEMFHRLKQEDADWYLEQRAAQGYNCVFAVALAEHDVSVPNAYGDLALQDMDPTKPNEAYFARVDAMVKKAESLGIYVGMLPTWGDKWNLKWGKGPEMFTPENARTFGEWMGKRYKSSPIIWILGGDRPVENDRHREIIRAMAQGARQGDEGAHLISFHPSGTKNSAEFWPDEKWLDIHMFQSGHGKAKDKPNYEYNLSNRELTPTKPTFEGEPRYEDHPVRGVPDEGSEWYDAFDVRQAAWWNILSGACGHTYGDHNIWQFLTKDHPPITMARTPWKEAVKHEGALQMGYMRTFMESLAWQKLEPKDELLKGNKGEGGSRMLAMMSREKKEAVIYSPHGLPVEMDLNDFEGWKPGTPMLTVWFNPRDGQTDSFSVLHSKDSAVKRVPSGEPARGNDWVLWMKISNVKEAAHFWKFQQGRSVQSAPKPRAESE